MTHKSIVVALGGNAILTDDPSEEGQRKAVKKASKSLVKFVNNGDRLIITHGNGPQVGNLLLQQLNSNSPQNPAMPLDTVGAMTEGSIGYWIQNALQKELLDNDLHRDVVTIVTQTVVAQNDPAFNKFSKPIGPFYEEEELVKIHKKYPGWTLMEDAQRGYRRVVPSPKPQEIKEANVIKILIENNVIPIVSGGGGIPVVKDGNKLLGKEAVIDKDFSAAKVAELVKADELIILTSVSNVFYNFGQSDQKEIKKVNVAELEAGIDKGYFAAGSMLPKVQAAINFVKNTNKTAIIGSLDDVSGIIKGEKGTVIIP
ncbi:carbamate kinase [Lactobacillus sp. ESL0791]|uniref:carbamate kinase n=1 Tax=Lactobacillus sp. ESL0791 TaxID=2983234 RepID=UPI0023F66B8E|nr:carbamate kinase [Lactobacillus sp. ESL0791]MDF7638214.1 carbamate kinase [Lactobacillus sp. ESL0791]